ncbi:hypothetical protein P3X46_034741 [Hevea brasiliensis]|uniref:glutathione transferase n=1 Tax=Hevea brasiliensis TaxID=3981 RepID=A0ABQ9KDW8_HEVBR|nr:probable glutathione S-transferase [Hevea brasiliensis]KAJ9131829.1 hypothetical protein P3X46_034741 [Hevea brasiliensis]
MAEQEVKLLGAGTSPFVHRVKVALELKGIPYEYIQEDVFNKSSLLLKYNPVFKKIPVLVHNQKPISESLVILEYIDETWKHNPMFPQDAHEKAMARFWAKFIDDKVTTAIRGVLTTEGVQQQENEKHAMEALQVIEGELKGKKFFGGECIGFVDIVMGGITLWLEALEEAAGVKIHDPEKYPSIDKWMQNFAQLPVIKESLPQRDILLQYFRKGRQFSLALAAGK